ncbi:YdeI family protein [Streptomonospora halophila]|uniref:YdeI family protein n=1 Tax=Streptomonospora halophila TaxID=427369 RepID=A0ABP9GCD3_9ACTN
MADQPLVFATAQQLAEWFEEHHRTVGHIWVAFPKKGTDARALTRSEVLDLALCYGWIDGQASSAGTPEGWWAQRYSPRRPRSPWSKINCAKAEELISAGRMRPAGLEEVERAKADGRWDAAYDPPSTASVPDDLREALDAVPAAAEAFAALNRSSRFTILYSLQEAKRPETRARRVADYVARLAAGDPPRPPQRRKPR